MSEFGVVAVVFGCLGSYAIGYIMGWRRGFCDCAVQAKAKIRELEAKLELEENETEDEDWWKGD